MQASKHPASPGSEALNQMKIPLHVVLPVLLAASTAGVSAQGTPGTNKPATGPRPATAAAPVIAGGSTTNAAGSVGKPGPKHLPFQGPVKSTDTNAMTVTLTGAQNTERVLRLDGESRLIKAGKPAVLADLAPGDFARGVVRKNDRGEDVIAHGTFGPRPTPRPKPAARPQAPGNARPAPGAAAPAGAAPAAPAPNK